MTKYERASQLWAILALAATNRQVLSYGLVSQLTGIPRSAIGGLLEPIQSYCQRQQISPLTSIVVSEKTGLPGDRFIGAENVPKAQAETFTFDWLEAKARLFG